MIDLILGDALPYLIGAVAFLGSIVLAFFKGGRAAKNKQKLADMKRSSDIRDKADEAREISADDKRSGDDRLRDHGRLGE